MSFNPLTSDPQFYKLQRYTRDSPFFTLELESKDGAGLAELLIQTCQVCDALLGNSPTQNTSLSAPMTLAWINCQSTEEDANKEPSQIDKVGCVFHSVCFQRMLNEQQNCPRCQTPIDQAQVARAHLPDSVVHRMVEMCQIYSFAESEGTRVRIKEVGDLIRNILSKEPSKQEVIQVQFLILSAIKDQIFGKEGTVEFVNAFNKWSAQRQAQALALLNEVSSLGGRLDLIETLLSNEKNRYIRGLALVCATLAQAKDEVIDLLLKEGISKEEGALALELAGFNCRIDVIEKILSALISEERFEEEFDSIMNTLFRAKSALVLQVFLKRGLSPEHLEKLLSEAVSRDCESYLSELLKNPISNELFSQLLMKASTQDKGMCLKALLEQSTTEAQRDQLLLASLRAIDSPSIVNMLIQAGVSQGAAIEALGLAYQLGRTEAVEPLRSQVGRVRSTLSYFGSFFASGSH